MPYLKRITVRQVPQRQPLMGLGYSDSDQCSTIPLKDAYRKPGNYCATPDGGIVTFNADGSTYRAPGTTVDPDPAHPAGGGSVWDKIGSAIGILGPPVPAATIPAQTGMSTTTKIALAGGAVLIVALIARRK